jgi:hypothetical protein
LGIVDGGDFHAFLRNTLLRAMLAALEFPGLLEDLLEGFLAVRKSNPGVAISFRAPEPDGKIPRHERSPRIFMIPVCGRCDGGSGVTFLEK